MTNANSVFDLMNLYIDKFADEQLISLFETKFFEARLIDANVHLGSTSSKDHLKFQLEKKKDHLSSDQLQTGFQAVSYQLMGNYHHQRRLTLNLFRLALGLGLVVVVLLGVGVVLQLHYLSWIGLALVIGVAIVLFLYRSELARLQYTEKHLQRIELFKVQLDLLSLIPDEISRKLGYQKIIDAMTNNTAYHNVRNTYNLGGVKKQINIQQQHGNVHS